MRKEVLSHTGGMPMLNETVKLKLREWFESQGGIRVSRSATFDAGRVSRSATFDAGSNPFHRRVGYTPSRSDSQDTFDETDV